MNFANAPRMRNVRFQLFALLAMVSSACPAHSGETYSFELDEIEKKNYEIGGFAELKWEHIDIREDGSAAFLSFYQEPRSSLDRLAGSLQLEGIFTKGIGQFQWLAQATASQGDLGWSDSFELYEGFAGITPSSEFHAGVGKKSYKWGKGYAWNPVGFINRIKDPNNPEEAMEGYVTTEAEWIKSFAGDLQNVALTTVLLPVWQDVNEDFGTGDTVNLAAKLYLLLLDTDLDLMVYTGDSRTSRFGLDFSRNITTNFEIHGEIAYYNSLEKVTLVEDGGRSLQQDDATSYLAGIRYLNARDLTTIIEYYYNGWGYSEDEMSLFFEGVADAEEQWLTTGGEGSLREISSLGAQGYAKINPGKEYLYARFSQKEPFDLLYFTPSLTTIINLNDQSFSLTPEIIYTGITNWELRLQFVLLQGDTATEFGEKQNENKLELRARYFF